MRASVGAAGASANQIASQRELAAHCQSHARTLTQTGRAAEANEAIAGRRAVCEHVCEILLARRQPEPVLRHCQELIELISEPEHASQHGGTSHGSAAKVCVNVAKRAVELEPSLRRPARTLAGAAGRQLLGAADDAEL